MAKRPISTCREHTDVEWLTHLADGAHFHMQGAYTS